jgi:hypothetical protein
MPIEVLFPSSFSTTSSGPGKDDTNVGFQFSPMANTLQTPITPSPERQSPSSALLSHSSPPQNALTRRISSLEGTIEYQKTAHSDQLKGLHEEIKRLQNVCNELSLKQSNGDDDGMSLSDYCKSESINAQLFQLQLIWEYQAPRGGRLQWQDEDRV